MVAVVAVWRRDFGGVKERKVCTGSENLEWFGWKMRELGECGVLAFRALFSESLWASPSVAEQYNKVERDRDWWTQSRSCSSCGVFYGVMGLCGDDHQGAARVQAC